MLYIKLVGPIDKAKDNGFNRAFFTASNMQDCLEQVLHYSAAPLRKTGEIDLSVGGQNVISCLEDPRRVGKVGVKIQFGSTCALWGGSLQV